MKVLWYDICLEGDMDPMEFTDEQLAILPPCITQVLGADQPQYRSLPVVRLTGPEGRIISRWQLTDDERMKLVAGADLFIEQLTFNSPLQPILPTIELRDICPADA